MDWCAEIKPTWSGWVGWGIMRANRLAMIFAYNLRSVFNNEIEWKLWGDTSSFPGLGRVTMVAESMSDGNVPEDIAALTSLAV